MNKKQTKILRITLIAAIVPVTFALIILIWALSILPGRKELTGYRNATASVVLSREGDLIGKIFTENRTNVAYGKIPVHLVDALIATEDVRFYDHKGIDRRSLLRVFIKTILFRKQEAGGGSTLTQQLAKNMYGRKRSGPFSILLCKTKEALLAHRLEKLFTKQDILTLYLNTVPFGENVFGIEAASQRYFNKNADQLKREESAVLVGMLKANSLYNPRLYPDNATNRRNVVFRQMQKYKYLEKATADSLTRLPLILNYSKLESEGPADYFLYQVKKEAQQILKEINSSNGKDWKIEEDGLIITTTLNLTLQQYANRSFREHLAIMQKRLNKQYQSRSGKKFIDNLAQSELKNPDLAEKAGEVGLRLIFDWDGTVYDSISLVDSLKQALQLLHAGLVAMDPLTGAVKAWVGGIDFKTQPYDQVLARRQMGSTFKPVLYAAALEKGIKPCYYLDNDSVMLPGYEEWRPNNFDLSLGGKYSLAGALVHSMNIPTLNLFLIVGFERLNILWRKMGFVFPLMNTPSLAMGTAEANIEELAVAYSAFPNGGYKISPQKLISIKSPDGEVLWQNEFSEVKERIMEEKTALLMNVILQRAVRDGTGITLHSVYGVSLPVAGKTGTSQEYTDAWFAAFTPSLVMVSRVGASLPSVHFNHGSYGSGSALALPLVAMTMKQIQTDRGLREQLMAPFPALTPELESELICPDFRENNIIEDIMDIFKRKRLTFDKPAKRPVRKKRPFFRRGSGSQE